MSRTIAFGVAQTQGQRDAQEDAVNWTADLRDSQQGRPRLIVVADGMGGHAAGDVASKLATGSFITAYRRDVGAEGVLAEALDHANEKLADYITRESSADGMGCTLVALELNENGTAYRWLSVGDSPLLSIRSDDIARLNDDHSFREERRRMAEQGVDVSAMPSPSMLRSAVMGSPIPLVDDHRTWRSFAEGEILVVATDGIETLDLQQIAEIARRAPDAEAAAALLVDAVEAARRPRQDNTTVVVVHGTAEGAATVAAPRIEWAPGMGGLQSRPPAPRSSSAARAFAAGLLAGIPAGALLFWGATSLQWGDTPQATNVGGETMNSEVPRTAVPGVPSAVPPSVATVSPSAVPTETPAATRRNGAVGGRTGGSGSSVSNAGSNGAGSNGAGGSVAERRGGDGDGTAAGGLAAGDGDVAAGSEVGAGAGTGRRDDVSSDQDSDRGGSENDVRAAGAAGGEAAPAAGEN
ncbi:MAG TPA: PP2C family protein-serine/threonine phosphatase [Croceibacterium sp.]